jgi:hypothetical protein
MAAIVAGTSIFWSVAVAARVGGCAHAIVENPLRRLRAEIQATAVEKPLGKGSIALGKRAPERLDPRRILMQDEN